MTFGTDYAAAYESLYQDKHYSAECDLLESIFRQCGQGPINRVLDFGCGTGGHANLLAERGYTVVGVDRSEDMLRQARTHATTCRFERGDVTSVRLGETFDAVLMMFAVLGYQTTNEQVLNALKTARCHLHDGGLLFADVWYGP